ncbi:MAG TPA: hypothetical protein VL359_11830, partial [bacterium]|nr:hypothetical protein [bacterium]
MTVWHSSPRAGRMVLALAGLLLLLPWAGLSLARADAASDALRKDIDLMERESKARAAIVKQVAPAVVNITVEKNVKASDNTNDGGDDQPDPFNDPFFRRFFEPRIPGPPRDYRQMGLGSGTIVDPAG